MLKQQLNFKLSQELSPQQIQLMKLIQLPTQAFEQRISQEMEENPALDSGKDEGDSMDDEFNNEEYDDFDEGNEIIETDINVDDYLSDDETPSYKLSANNYSADDEEKQTPYASGTSFTQYLTQQLSTYRLDEEEREIAQFLVGSVDESGYIRRDIQDIVDDLAFTQNVYTTEEKIEKVLELVQDLDPAGVAARDLQECLLLQLKRKSENESVLLAIRIIEETFDHFTKKHYKKLLSKFDISEDVLREAIHEIESLNPKPGGTYSGNTRMVEHVVPDFAIKIVDGELELTLNGRNAPELHVSREYTNMLKGYKDSTKKSKSQKDAVMFIKQKLDAAKWFIDAIKQRQQTLFVTMNAIMRHQEEYFLSGDERKLKPMILKDIADKIHMDVSTVSRVANSKYVDTPYGTKLIKEFFSESMKNDQGEDVSTKEIKKILEITISEENKKKPLTDDKLAKILLEKGYPIARRTVAKYREQLDLPVARLRKRDLMNNFLRFGAYLLHPLLMPLLGGFVYYIITPRFVESEIIRANLFAVAIITLFVPMVLFLLLKNLGWITSKELHNVSERKIPLMLQCLLVLLIVKLVFDPYNSPELYFFFVGILFSSISALILVIFKIKVSLHQMGIAGVTLFVIALSVHFKVNMLLWIGLFILANGWVASSRLHTNSHTYPELVLGFVVGFIPQLLMLNFWL